MRVYVFVSVFPSLSETFVLGQITGLIDRGHDVVVVSRTRGDGPAHAEVGAYGLDKSCRYYPKRSLDPGTPGKGLWSWLGTAAANPRFALGATNPLRFGRRATSGRVLFEGLAWVDAAKELGPPDVVLAHHGGNGHNAVRVRRAGAFDAPVVTVFHGSDANRARAGKFDELWRFGDLMLPVSEFLREKLVSIGCPEAKAQVHHMGIDVDAFAAPAREPGDVLELISVGRLVPVKGFEHSIRAIGMLPQALRARVRYTIVGGGPDEAKLNALVQDLGLEATVDLVGGQPRDRVAELLKSSDAMLFPSAPTPEGEREGIPMAIAEAMASGMPVVATRLGGIPELVRDGTDGIIVEPADIQAMASAVERLEQDPRLRRTMGEAGAKRVRERHNVHTLNDRLVRILESVQRGDRVGVSV